MKKTKVNRAFKTYPTIRELTEVVVAQGQQIAEMTAAIDAQRHVIGALLGSTRWCLTELKHPAMVQSDTAEQTTDAGLVLPPAAGKIVLTDN